MSERSVVTVLKADLSGSTKLAERLDPEELRAVLGVYFTALAREIHRNGGTVDKFVGDGLFAVFGLSERHPDDASRAVFAAIAMQEAIARENAELRSRYGLELTCRIGVATGDVVVGAVPSDIQAGDTFVGAPISLADALESAAPLGGVLVSPATRDVSRREIRYANRESVRPKEATAAVDAFRVVGALHPVTERVATSSRAPGSASLQVASKRADVLAEERKVVTILFADVMPSEPLGERLSTADLRAALGSYFGALARAIQHYGGTLDKYIGDAVMAVFGAPVSHDDDAIRALYAAVAIRDAIARASEELAARHGIRLVVRIGVNTGEVVAGLQPGEVRAYTVTGDAVNTAQRIESATPAGAIYVSESTHLLSRSMFDARARAALTVKGKSEPVPVFELLGRREVVAQAGTTPFVGRSAELALLGRRAAESLEGSGRVVHVHGDAGVGKSRLVAEVLAGIPASTVRLRARCNSFESATPYAAIADVLRRTFDLQPGEAERVVVEHVSHGLSHLEPRTRDAALALFLEVMGYGERSPLGPDAKRGLLVSLLRGLLDAWAASGIVIVIEDLHWIDAASAETLASVVPEVARLRCLVMTTSREPGCPWPAEGLELQPVDEASALRIVEHAFGTSLDEKTRALVLERAGGNPFFLEEIAQTLASRGTGSIPTTVQEVLEARLDALDVEPRLVAQRASVIGRTFWQNVLERVTPNVALDDALATLERQRFIRLRDPTPERTYAFSHALVQEVVYRTQLVSQRRATHVQVGDAIVALYAGRLDEFVDVLAYQYRSGDDDTKAGQWLLRAGRRAQRLYANTEALDYLQATIERSVANAPLRAEAHEAMGDVRRVTGRYEDALAAYELALAALDGTDVVSDARVHRKTGIVEQLRGHVDVALRIFEHAYAQLPSDAADERARAQLNVADLLFRDGQPDVAITHLNIALAEAEGIDDDEARAEALKQLGTIHAYKGELAKALDYQQRSLDAYVRIGDLLGQANVHNNIGRTEKRRGRCTEALAAYARALAVRERIGDQLGRIHSHGNIGEIRYLRDELDEAERHYTAVIDLSRSIGYAFGVNAGLVGLGAVDVARGESARGIARLTEAIAEFERGGQRTYLVEALRDLTNAQIAARSHLALETAARAVGIARELALPELIAIAMETLGRARLSVHDPRGAADALEEAQTILAGGDDRLEQARTLALLGCAYAELPSIDARHTRSAAMLSEARSALAGLGAALELRQLLGSYELT